MRGAPVDVVLQRVPLFADLTKKEVQQIALLFKERRFQAGETVIREGSGGAAFFVIQTGEAKVLLGAKEHTTLKPGDYFGEIAMFDEGTRMGHAHGDDHRRERSRLFRAYVLGLSPGRGGQRRDRLEAAAADGPHAARRPRGLIGTTAPTVKRDVAVPEETGTTYRVTLDKSSSACRCSPT